MSRAVGSLHVEIVAGTTRLQLGVQQARQVLNAFAGDTERASRRTITASAAITGSIGRIAGALASLKTLALGVFAGIGVYRLVSSFNDAAQQVDKLGKASRRLGLDIGAVSTLRFYAEGSGIAFEQLSGAVAKLQRGLSEAAKSGTGPAYRAFRELGVGLRDANGGLKNAATLLPEVARQLSTVTATADKLRLADAIFGRGSGEDVVQMLGEAGEGLAGFAREAERARRLGVVFTPEQVQKLTEYNDAVNRIGEAWLGLRVRVMTELAPTLTEWADRISSFAAAVPKIINNVVRVLNAALTNNLSAEQRDKFKEVWSQWNKLVTEGVKGTFRVLGAALMDGASVLKQFGPAIVTSALNAVFIQPIASIQDLMLSKLEGIGTSVQTAVFTLNAAKLGYVAKGVAETTDKLTALRLELKNIEHARDNHSNYGAVNAIADALRLPTLREEIADTERELAKLQEDLGKGFKVSPAEQSLIDLGKTISAVIGDIRHLTKEGAAAVDETVAQFSASELERAITTTFDKGSKSAEALRATLQAMGVPASRIVELLDQLFKVSEAMAETDTSTKTLANTIGDTLPAAVTKSRDVLGEWMEGVRAGFKEMGEEADDFVQLGRRMSETFARDLTSGIADALLESGTNLGEFGRRVLDVFADVGKAVTKLALQFALMRAVTGVFAGVDAYFAGGSLPTSTAPGGGLPDFAGPYAPTYAARGAVRGPSQVYAFKSGGVVKGPSYFPGSDGNSTVLAGENPTNPYEGWLPLSMVNGQLGVSASGGVAVHVYDQRQRGEPVDVQSSRGADGRQVLRVMIRDETKRYVADGGLDRVIGETYGLSRKGVKR